MIHWTNPVLNGFYLAMGLATLAICYVKLKDFMNSLGISLLIILVASQLWEVPIFVVAYTGLFGYWVNFPLDLLNHALWVFLFALLLKASKWKTNEKHIWYGIGLIFLNAFLVVCIPHWIGGYGRLLFYILFLPARAITIAYLVYVTVVDNPCFGGSLNK